MPSVDLRLPKDLLTLCEESMLWASAFTADIYGEPNLFSLSALELYTVITQVGSYQDRTITDPTNPLFI